MICFFFIVWMIICNSANVAWTMKWVSDYKSYCVPVKFFDARACSQSIILDMHISESSVVLVHRFMSILLR